MPGNFEPMRRLLEAWREEQLSPDTAKSLQGQKPNCFAPKVGARCRRFGADDPIETNSAGWA